MGEHFVLHFVRFFNVSGYAVEFQNAVCGGEGRMAKSQRVAPK